MSKQNLVLPGISEKGKNEALQGFFLTDVDIDKKPFVK
jgi:hypothetical protein